MAAWLYAHGQNVICGTDFFFLSACLESSGKWELQLRKCLHHIGL